MITKYPLNLTIDARTREILEAESKASGLSISAVVAVLARHATKCPALQPDGLMEHEEEAFRRNAKRIASACTKNPPQNPSE